jgi:hypothetical protein
MGTDAPESMGFAVKQGNNMYINLEPDTHTETNRFFNALAANGKVEAPLQEMFWGGYLAASSTSLASTGCSIAPAGLDRASPVSTSLGFNFTIKDNHHE